MRGASLVVSAHRDLGMETLCERAVDITTARALVQRLLDGAESPRPLDELLVRHDGNLREVFFELYDTIGA